MEIKDIKRIVELVKNNELTEFSLKDKDFELVLKRGGEQVVYAAPPVATAPAMAPASAPVASPAPAEDATDDLPEILSPIVGTFYRKPSPDADVFVQVGDEVDEDTVVCIVEAMKVMNEIKAECKGVIKKILVEDASPVQYGQPLFLVEPK